MKPLQTSILIAVDIGNTRIHLGRFGRRSFQGHPRPEERLHLDHQADPQRLDDRFLPPEPVGWLMASVHVETLRRWEAWQQQYRPDDRFQRLDFRDVPLTLEVDCPERVGMDRLMGAVAAERLRRPGRPAIIIDMGTAVTVDALSPEGHFLGGAILPGIQMAAAALHRDTDALPMVRFDPSDPPVPIGKSTEPAIRSGLFWGTLGAIGELVERFSHGWNRQPDVFATGGSMEQISPLLPFPVRYDPDLILSGIILTGLAGKER